jgi:hypothetical protein
MALSDLVRMLSDFAEIAVTVLLAYVVLKIALLIDSLNGRIKSEKSTEPKA